MLSPGKLIWISRILEEVELDAYYQAIFKYKKFKTYLPGCPDNYKRVLRKSAVSYCLFDDDKLYYITDGELRYVPATWKERVYYLAKCHISEKGKHKCKNVMSQWMNDKKIAWKGISVDCTAFAAACPYCTLGETRNEPTGKPPPKDDPVLSLAEDNYSLLLNYLQKQTFPVKTLQSKVDAVTSIARHYMILKGVLYHKKGKSGELRCLEVGTKDRKVAMQAAHVKDGEHLAPSETLQRLSEKFVWNRMAESVATFVTGCCQKKDVVYVAPKSILNRNVEFFNKQFMNGLVDELLAGEGNFTDPVMHDISEVVKKEQETSPNEKSTQASGDEDSETEEQSQTPQKLADVKTEYSSDSDILNRTESTTENLTDTETASSLKENETRTKIISDKVTSTAVRSILPPDELEEESMQSTSPEKDSSATATKTAEEQPSADGANKEEAGKEEKKVSKMIHKKCEVCGMLFKGLNKYKAHMYGHTGIKPYPCTLCDKSFTLKKTLKFHLGKHAGQKPFLCNICGKRFHVPNSLRSHLQIHAKGGNNIHYCKLCNREFATDVRFEKHLKFKHPPEDEEHLCSQCGKKFCSRKSLKRHERSAHDAVKNHFCKICERGFFRKEYLNRHMEQHDPNRDGKKKKVKPMAIRKPKALQNKAKPETKTVAKTAPGNIIIQTVQDGGSSSVGNVVGNIRIEVEPGQIEEYYIQETQPVPENTFYVQESTTEGDQEGASSTLVYSFPSVQYEIECPDGELNSEALSAITMLAQASTQQNI